MPEYLAPGVYVEEIPSGNMPIQAASTSTAGMVGMTMRGPVGTPVLCTSLGDFNRRFGGRLNPARFSNGKDALPYAAEGFFLNGGARLYVVRVVGDAAAESSLAIHASQTFILAEEAPAGTDKLTLKDADNIVPVDTIQVAGERFKVLSSTTTTLTLGSGLSQDVKKTDKVVCTGRKKQEASLAEDANKDAIVIKLDNVTGLTKDSQIILPKNEPNSVYTVAKVDNAKKEVTLNEGLKKDAKKNDNLSYEEVLRSETMMDEDAPKGKTLLKLLSVKQIKAGDTLRVSATDYPVAAVDNDRKEVTLGAKLSQKASKGEAVTKIQHVMTAHAQWPGGWGDSVRISIDHASILETKLTKEASKGSSRLSLATAFGLFEGSLLRIGPIDKCEHTVVQSVDTKTGEVTLEKPLKSTWNDGVNVASQEFSLSVERLDNGKVVESESFSPLSLAPGHPRNAVDVIGFWNQKNQRPSRSGNSDLIRLELANPNNATTLPLQPSSAMLSGGSDDEDAVMAKDYKGTSSLDPDERTGIWALENEPSISIVAVPGQDLEVQQALVEHCEKMIYRFAALDVPINSSLSQAKSHRQNFDSTRCAMYYPALIIADSFGKPGDRRVIASTGHVLGIYARTDITRGVHKAPANEVVRGVLGFETMLTKGEQDILNPINLNCFRDFRSENRGLRLYGARVATSNPELRYINVRRLLLFIEKSLDTGLQWAVFEPNAEPLWDTVRQSITGFLTTVWRDGALEGTKPEEAFYVRIGYDITMTQADIDNGMLIAEIGVAPVKPAEFVILRISQKTREAKA